MVTGYLLHYLEDLLYITNINIISQHRGTTFNRVNICTNQNETLMKQMISYVTIEIAINVNIPSMLLLKHNEPAHIRMFHGKFAYLTKCSIFTR
jgi:hypothetical protein